MTEPITILSAKPVELPESMIPNDLEPHVHSEISGDDETVQPWLIRIFCLLDIHKEEDFYTYIDLSVSVMEMFNKLIPEKTVTLTSKAEENLPFKLWQIELVVSAEEMYYCRVAHVVVKTKTRKKRATTIAQTAAGKDLL